MYELNDLLCLLRASQPLIRIQTHEERRALDLVSRCGRKLQQPVMKWSITNGLVMADTGQPKLSLAGPAVDNNDSGKPEPAKVLRDIRNSRNAGIYVLLDFHHYLDDPVIVRLIKEIAQDYEVTNHHLVFISHDLSMPDELGRFTTLFQLTLPDPSAIRKLVMAEVKIWRLKNNNEKLQADRKAIDLLVNNLGGLSVSEAKRLIRNAIYDDDAISHTDVERVQKAKYELLGQGGLLHFELETSSFEQVGGLNKLREWLSWRKQVFLSSDPLPGMDRPKGILLVGVQGGGKSLAAKAVAGMWGVPLLRLDFGKLYNKYFGETEKNIREAVGIAEVMSPCVLWIDEIEKAISTGDYDSGTSQRLLATLLTWMAENRKPVFIVATANDITGLPPELIRKGRLDEIFFIDLPAQLIREDIITIHCDKRSIDHSVLDLHLLARETDGFSGAELEQAVVSALYKSHAGNVPVSTEILLAEIQATRPLSTVMAESMNKLRNWAVERTVMAD